MGKTTLSHVNLTLKDDIILQKAVATELTAEDKNIEDILAFELKEECKDEVTGKSH